ncbi:MAG: TspO/MBR family protein [Candidatus Woesearchaeota archaeon]
MKINYIRLVISIMICQLAGVIGSLFTANSVSTWYVDLVKPSFNPPSWIFGPVWIILYLLMGISLYLVWVKRTDKLALSVFGIQLFLNSLWSILFFGLRNPLFAFVEIIFLWVMILYSFILFYKISKKAAYLLVPYLLWVSFAAVLNIFLYLLN